MAKVTVNPVGSLENQTTFVQTVNDNFASIAAALETLLSRDGTTPNEMTASLDMNSKRILNLPSPITSAEPARLVDLQEAQALDSAVVPSLTGNGGKFMSNDETVLTWVDPADIAGLGDLVSTNNLSELTDVVVARNNLDLGTAATYDIGTSGNNVPLLNGASTWSGNQVFNGTSSFAGAVTFSGTGDHRLAGTPSALTPESIGFRGAPLATQDADYTFVLADAGRGKVHTSGTGHTYTIPTNTTVAYPLGTILLVRNIGVGSVSIARAGGVTLRKAGVSTNANASVTQWGFAYILKEGTDTWVISGTGVT